MEHIAESRTHSSHARMDIKYQKSSMIIHFLSFFTFPASLAANLKKEKTCCYSVLGGRWEANRSLPELRGHVTKYVSSWNYYELNYSMNVQPELLCIISYLK